MNDKQVQAKKQYDKYCQGIARDRHISIAESKQLAICEEYRKYCEEVFCVRILK